MPLIIVLTRTRDRDPATRFFARISRVRHSVFSWRGTQLDDASPFDGFPPTAEAPTPPADFPPATDIPPNGEPTAQVADAPAAESSTPATGRPPSAESSPPADTSPSAPESPLPVTDSADDPPPYNSIPGAEMTRARDGPCKLPQPRAVYR